MTDDIRKRKGKQYLSTMFHWTKSMFLIKSLNAKKSKQNAEFSKLGVPDSVGGGKFLMWPESGKQSFEVNRKVEGASFRIVGFVKLSKLTRLSFTAHFLLQCSFYFFCQKKVGTHIPPCSWPLRPCSIRKSRYLLDEQHGEKYNSQMRNQMHCKPLKWLPLWYIQTFLVSPNTTMSHSH